MPTNTTITAYYAFKPYTKARAVQLNTNFSAFRGHILPVDADTATASDQKYNLGSSDYYWRKGYFTGLDLGISSTSALMGQANTLGGMDFGNANTTTASIVGNTFKAKNATLIGMTTDAYAGQMALSALLHLESFEVVAGTTTQYVLGSTITLQGIGRPVQLGLINNFDSNSTSGFFLHQYTTAASIVSCHINFMDAANDTLASYEVLQNGGDKYIPPGAFDIVANQLGYGDPFGYRIEIRLDTSTSLDSFNYLFRNVRFFAREI